MDLRRSFSLTAGGLLLAARAAAASSAVSASAVRLTLPPAAAFPAPLAARPADGRPPLETLLRRFRSLAARGWTEALVHETAEGLPIRSYRTARQGPALWVVAGIHGEEPAGPTALAHSLGELRALARRGVPVVVLPLANPKGYRENWRYPNTPDRDWRGGGASVGDAEHLLPAEDGTRARRDAPAGPESAALTAHALALARTHPPVLVVDLHEDELSADGYVYAQGRDAAGHPAAAEAVRLLRASGVTLRRSGLTRFGEPVEDGVVAADAQGRPLRDGSLDELLSAREVVIGGRRVPGPGAGLVLVLETPTYGGTALARRAAAHAAVLRRLGALWAMVRRP